MSNRKTHPTTRRQFLATAAVPMILPSSVLGENAPSKQITMGCIGVRGMG
ncbi:MAG: gfo/Idh/MocA family oxidoreductase, partial [Planctomycetes bacterium]|nr:gfo/Idh/MocA family oxidoreductase [Planctomycetota bacterium]